MLTIRNLRKTYEDATVVDDVSLDLPHGKVISMIGPNGAGKSTVLGMISRLVAKSSGAVEFQGKDLEKWESRELAKHLAILTQANNVQMKLTVRELVAFGRFPHSGSNLSQKDWEIVDRSISYMELEDFAERFIDEMSGGQRQRAFIAMVLHEINLAAFYSDYICAFKNGKIAAWGTVNEVMTPEQLKLIYGVDFQIHEIDGRPLAIFH